MFKKDRPHYRTCPAWCKKHHRDEARERLHTCRVGEHGAESFTVAMHEDKNTVSFASAESSGRLFTPVTIDEVDTWCNQFRDGELALLLAVPVDAVTVGPGVDADVDRQLLSGLCERLGFARGEVFDVHDEAD